ncbi:hypothetical protein HOD38_02545 [archaeon]|jgi:type I restriction enzyme, S subunit|nr:hypothetical protein [archaeon]MBT4397122.1 hypothetical protein [archaeon]MBT4441572.1 hypothetical protein [archaeon]
MVWNRVTISSFLKERSDRIKPDQANELGLQRLEKIDFSGKIHLNDNKPTRTGMIFVKKGDLVISGINVEKGAVAVYMGDEDVLATIHYSSYNFDKKKIDVEYFKWFLKSEAFRAAINSQIKGGIKTELKPKKFLPLKIDLPDLDTQIEIRNKLNAVNNEINETINIQYENDKLLIKLRQAILSEAIRGKLIPQDNNDEPASVLIEKIKAEKEKLIKEKKIKKDKLLPKIKEDEVPYKLPNGWVWVRLNDIVKFNPRNKVDDESNVSFIPMRLIKCGYNNQHSFEINKWKNIKKGFTHFKERDVAFAKITPCFENRKSTILTDLEGGCGAGTTEIIILRPFNELFLPELILYLVKSEEFIQFGLSTYTGTAGQQRVNINKLKKLVVGLPPLNEQKRIVDKVDKLMNLCDQLENKVKGNQNISEALMATVLREAFKIKN